MLTDKLLADVDDFQGVLTDPLFVHLDRLGYRTLLHLAAILATPHTARFLKPEKEPLMTIRSATEKQLETLIPGSVVDLHASDGPELNRLFPGGRGRYAGGYLQDRRGLQLGQPVPPRPTPPEEPRPAGDDWATPLPVRCLPAKKWPRIENQGTRGTCVAFAAAALYYGACLKFGRPPQLLSVQYLYAYAKRERTELRRTDGTTVNLKPIDGTTFEAVLDVLKRAGACLENELSYQLEHDFGQFHTIRPDEEPIMDEDDLEKCAQKNRIKSHRPVRLTTEAVRRELFNGRPVAVGIPLYEIAWRNPVTTSTGEVLMPLTVPDPDGGEHPLLADLFAGGHAIAVIGYQDAKPGFRPAGGGAFLFRNSWGAEWAGENLEFRPGYGWLPYDYLEQYAQEAYVIDELA